MTPLKVRHQLMDALQIDLICLNGSLGTHEALDFVAIEGRWGRSVESAFSEDPIAS